ncbi:MAG TPA: hypothetical protein PLN48_07635 [Lachnospiraceae bacterium]|nr:hypothetical protein [Lachnospiraceae bacterium]
MAFIHYLRIDGTELPLPISYDLSLSDVTADSSGETEAGTTQRDVVRSGVATISVSFQVSPVWLKKLSTMRKQPKLSVDFFNTETMIRENREMYIDGFKTSLEHDTSRKGLWKVSFSLKEY